PGGRGPLRRRLRGEPPARRRPRHADLALRGRRAAGSAPERSVRVSDHLDDLRASVRGLLESQAPLATVRNTALPGKPRDTAAWHRLAIEIGVHGLPFAEADGGAGAGQAELVVALEETGSVLLDQPLLTTVLAGQLVAETVDGPARAELLPAIAAGEL